MKKRCNHCRQVKDENEFNWRWKAKGIRQGACKICKAKQDKKWYRNKGEAHRIKSVQQKKDRRAEARAFIWDYLKKHPCVDCGEKNPTVLEFDHVRGNKVTNVSSMVGRGYSIARIQKEIDKCVVRCANCHREKTSRQKGWYKRG